MVCSLSDLKDKEVVNVVNGMKIGYVDDIEFDTETSAVTAMVIYGREKMFGFLGREEDIIISCKEIQLIGKDTILVASKLETSSELPKARVFSLENLYK